VFEFQPDDLTEAPRHALNQTMLKAEKLVHLINQLEVMLDARDLFFFIPCLPLMLSIISLPLLFILRDFEDI
jgi:hypothetical protein